MDQPLHRHSLEVPFGDTDASGWMHFPNLFRYVEAAEHSFLRSRGLLVFDRAQGGWPRVHVSCEYRHPLLTGDRIEVQLRVLRLGGSSVHWEFEVIHSSGQTAAEGRMTTVRVDSCGKPQKLRAEERSAFQAEA